MKRAALFFFALSSQTIADTPVNHAINPLPRSGEWIKRHESFNAISKKGEAQLVFLGDSITHFWETEGKATWDKTWAPLKAANFGISGDRTEHVLWRLQNGNLEGLKPKLIVLMIGTNNTGHQNRPAPELGGATYLCTAEQTASGIKAILDLLGKKLPKTKDQSAPTRHLPSSHAVRMPRTPCASKTPPPITNHQSPISSSPATPFNYRPALMLSRLSSPVAQTSPPAHHASASRLPSAACQIAPGTPETQTPRTPARLWPPRH